MCLVWPLTPYGTIGTRDTTGTTIGIGLGLGLGLVLFTTYIYDGYRRVAYHWIRLNELIIKMCLVWSLTPYGTIGTRDTTGTTIGTIGLYVVNCTKPMYVYIRRIPSSSIPVDSPWWADHENVFSLVMWHFLYELSPTEVFAHGDNCQKRDFQSVVAKNLKFRFRKFQQHLRERRTLILTSYYSILYVA
jgi:hypothetical protein